MVVPDFAPPQSAGGGYQPVFNFQGFGGGGSNQYGSFPVMTGGSGSYGVGSNYPPGIVPPQGSYSSGSVVGYPSIGPNPQSQYGPYIPGTLENVGEEQKVGGGMREGPTLDPALTQSLAGYLQSQVGQGITPFDLSAILPSSGQATTPGTLTAPLTSLMQQLQSFYSGQGGGVSGVPGSSGPLSYILPMWQSEIQSMQQPIQENLANLKEQYGSMGLLDSSAAATGLSDYLAQTATGEQSLLGQLTLQALPQEQTMAGGLQTLDQQSIQNLLQQFELTQPQNNPLLNEMYGMSTTFPPLFSKGGGSLTAAIGGLGDAASGISAGLGAAGGGSGLLGSILAGLGAI